MPSNPTSTQRQEVRYIGPAGFTSKIEVDNDKIQLRNGYSLLKKSIIKEGDILIERTNPHRICYIGSVEEVGDYHCTTLLEMEVRCMCGVYLVRPHKQNGWDNAFIASQLSEWVESGICSTQIPENTMNVSYLREVFIPSIDLETQKSIGRLWTTGEQYIAKQQLIVDTLKQLMRTHLQMATHKNTIEREK